MGLSTDLTGNITMSPGGIVLPSDCFFAKAETARRAIEDAVSNPRYMICKKKVGDSFRVGLTESKKNANGIHLTEWRYFGAD